MQLQWESEGFSYRLICDVVVAVSVSKRTKPLLDSLRWTNASTCDNKIILVAHPLDSLDDIPLVVCNNLDTFESLPHHQYPFADGIEKYTIPSLKQNFAMYAEFVCIPISHCISLCVVLRTHINSLHQKLAIVCQNIPVSPRRLYLPT